MKSISPAFFETGLKSRYCCLCQAWHGPGRRGCLAVHHHPLTHDHALLDLDEQAAFIDVQSGVVVGERIEVNGSEVSEYSHPSQSAAAHSASAGNSNSRFGQSLAFKPLSPSRMALCSSDAAGA